MFNSTPKFYTHIRFVPTCVRISGYSMPITQSSFKTIQIPTLTCSTTLSADLPDPSESRQDFINDYKQCDNKRGLRWHTSN